ncbi:Lon protease 2 [Clostridium haemolyticum]|uniref:ATP-dependent protease LonB n=1 Tax=Clostridium haemolyticum TaxID=84025 RepID=UPI0009C4E31A|nr:ATP-dependent protease LonB [Clostridium haemolyticum]OOB76730.1 Lon protease [Clostridium haemolyticum]CAG7839391.1 Lon protease 2 [Clostridium haemolyticum]
MSGSLMGFVSLGVTIIMGMYFFNALKEQKNNKCIVNRENKKEVEKLRKLKEIKLTEPLTEKSRPKSFKEIIGQEKGLKALEAAICGPNPQHVIIYGPPGVGKTAAARVVLENAKNKEYSPFNKNAKFVEIDATTVRFDDRGIADPLIGSVHDPIYQGAGALGSAGIPQPKPGAVTKAHGGILFIDEIGELHPVETNKLLKVMEDRKVFLESAYYNSEDPNMPSYIKDIFDNGLPADFRLVGATTRSPQEMCPAIRSRCVEIFFRSLTAEEIEDIADNTIKKIGFNIEDKAKVLVGKYCTNGRDAVSLVQLSSGIALNEGRKKIKVEDMEWIIENGQYAPRPEKIIPKEPKVGYVNGLAVYGSNIGIVMEIEATATKVISRKGNFKITGIVEEEEMDSSNKKIKRKSTACSSAENVLTVLENVFNIDCDQYDIHLNFPGGMPVDGPSAGISMVTAIYSAIMRMPVNNEVAMTGEISIHGLVKPIGGVNAKVNAAKKAGAKTVIIPKENWQQRFKNDKSINVIPVTDIKEVIKLALIPEEKCENKESVIKVKTNVDILTAESAINS